MLTSARPGTCDPLVNTTYVQGIEYLQNTLVPPGGKCNVGAAVQDFINKNEQLAATQAVNKMFSELEESQQGNCQYCFGSVHLGQKAPQPFSRVSMQQLISRESGSKDLLPAPAPDAIRVVNPALVRTGLFGVDRGQDTQASVLYGIQHISVPQRRSLS